MQNRWGRVARTCKLLNQISSDNVLWKQKLKNENIELPSNSTTALKTYYKDKSRFGSAKLLSPGTNLETPTLKILLVGESEAKKSQLLRRLGGQNNSLINFDSLNFDTGGLDFKIQYFNIDGNVVKLQVWDTVGLDKLRDICIGYYKNTKGIFLTFNYENRNSFTVLRSHYNNIQRYAPNDCKVTILGVTNDHNTQAVIDTQEVKAFADELNLEYMNINLTDSNEIIEAFAALTRQILPQKQGSKVEQEETKGKSCRVM